MQGLCCFCLCVSIGIFWLRNLVSGFSLYLFQCVYSFIVVYDVGYGVVDVDVVIVFVYEFIWFYQKVFLVMVIQ